MRHLDNIDLRLLRVFLTLVEAGNFSNALIALNLSQSTLSTHLATLEKTLGGTLCLRGRRGFRLTPFGEETYAAVKRLFADIDAFQQRIGGYNGELVGRLRVGVVDGVVTSPHLALQSVINRFMTLGSNVFIDLMLGTPQELELAITNGQRDIVIGPFSQKAPNITYVPIHNEQHLLYCGRGHPLFDVPAALITQSLIEGARFSVRGYRQLDDLFRVDHPRASGTVIHMEAQVMLILSGRFIGFLPRHIGDNWAAQGAMRTLKPEVYQFKSLHFAAHPPGDRHQPLLRAFLEALVAQSDNPPAPRIEQTGR